MEKTIYRRWTPAEMQKLQNLYGQVDIESLCKKLKCSYSRLRRKIKADGMGYQREYGEFITMRQVRQIMGVQHYQIQNYIKHGLPVIRIRFGPSERGNIIVSIDRLVKWLKSNQEMWKASKIEHMALGQEPDWLRQKRRQERLSK